MKVEHTKPDMELIKRVDGFTVGVSAHRDVAEAIQSAVNDGPGEYEIIQPNIRVTVKE